MALILDTGILYAVHDRRDSWHRRAADLLKRESGLLVVPAPIIPEVDHFLAKRLGPAAQLTFYRDISGGAYFVADLPREKYGRIEELHRQFSGLSLGFVDASVIVISEVLALQRIATTDRRHFTPVAAALGLELLP